MSRILVAGRWFLVDANECLIKLIQLIEEIYNALLQALCPMPALRSLKSEGGSSVF
jgi:hypothetical protein